MTPPDEIFFEPDNFSGRARLFPLPNLVLFPHVLQPLHVFEPRYRAMLEEALEGDRLIAMALLAPGWENDYDGRPPVRPVACLGRVTTYHRLEDGRYNVLLAGLKRVRLLEELPGSKPFREARVELCEDFYPPAGAAGRAELRRQLLGAFKKRLPEAGETHEQLEQLAAGDVCLGTLTDIMAYTVDLGLKLKERLLIEQNVDRRAAHLIRWFEGAAAALSTAGAPAGSFPPDFSAN